MRKLLLATIAATVVLPGMALADGPDRAGWQRDQTEVSRDHRDERGTRRNDTRNDSRSDAGWVMRDGRDVRGVREVQRNERAAWHDNDHRRWERNNRYGDRRGYYRYRSGVELPRYYWNDRFTWREGRYAYPGRGLRWVRYYDDLLLVNRAGRIVDVRYDVF